MPERTPDDRRRLDQLSELMDTLAELSHKINNPLTALMGRAQMLQAREGNDPYVQNTSDVIAEATRRIADHIRELSLVVREGRELVEAPPEA